MPQLLIPQVAKDQAVHYSKQWTQNGLVIVLDDTSIQFATDFANVVLKSFVLECQAKLVAAQNTTTVNANTVAQPQETPKDSKLII